jgi:hypothetical protein
MKNLSTLFKDQVLLICIGAWAVITASYFIFVAADYAVSPIAENGLDSLLTIYLPVLTFDGFFAPLPYSEQRASCLDKSI